MPLSSTLDALPVLEACRGDIESFEVTGGTMDDAFIAVTGKELQGMIGMAKRNLKLFFRDKSAVFFSLLAVFIIIGLYALFLGMSGRAAWRGCPRCGCSWTAGSSPAFWRSRR